MYWGKNGIGAGKCRSKESVPGLVQQIPEHHCVFFDNIGSIK